MKIDSLFGGFDNRRIEMSENQLISLNGENIQIDCLQGALWVTWPVSCERTIGQGQSVSVSSKGKVCIQAFSKSVVRIKSCNDFVNLMQTRLGAIFAMFRHAVEILNFHKNHTFRLSWPNNNVSDKN